jgi:polysaccharide pyruvyl transferase WcaK-like protein
LTAFKIHIIHVGNMNNKGTQALFKSDVYAINDTVKNEVSISVSTTDIEGVKRLNLPVNAVLSPVVDIPYEKADQLAKKFGCGRGSLRYKGFAVAMLVYMFVEVLLSVFSIVFIKLGLKAFYRSEVMEHIKDCDLVISHSDESFKESASLLPLNPYWVITWWSMLIARTWEILVAKSFGEPVVMFPNSVGPFRTWIGRSLSKLSLGNCDHVLIRDPTSYEIVNKLGIRASKSLTFDTALLFNPPHKNVLDDFPRPLMGVSPGIYSHSLSREEVRNYIMAHAKALDAAIEKYGFVVVFLPHYVSGFEYDDLEVCKLILHKMKNKNRVKIVSASTVEEFKLFLNQMDMVISSKMHPAVLAASGFVPMLCIAYDHKQTSFFERLNMIDCTLDIRSVSFESLLSKIDHVWNQKNRLKLLLKNQIPTWQKDIKKAIRRAIAPYADRK